MFLFNWLRSVDPITKKVEPVATLKQEQQSTQSDSALVDKLTQTQCVQITYSEYSSLLQRLDHLEIIVDTLTQHQVRQSNIRPVKATVKKCGLTMDAFQTELSTKLSALRSNMGESHGFAPGEIQSLIEEEQRQQFKY